MIVIDKIISRLVWPPKKTDLLSLVKLERVGCFADVGLSIKGLFVV